MAFSDQFPKLAAPAGGASQAVGKRRFHEVKQLVRSPTAVFPVPTTIPAISTSLLQTCFQYLCAKAVPKSTDCTCESS